MRRQTTSPTRAALAALVAPVLLLALLLGGCGDDDPSDQRLLNSVMVGSPDVLSEEDSETVSAIGLELVALAQPLQQWFDRSAPREELLARMTDAVDRIERRLTPERDSDVLATFEPYVAAWRRILDALEADDLEAYDQAVARIRELDERRIARVVEAYGEEDARRLLESEGVDPNR